jgi:hypothetical protein
VAATHTANPVHSTKEKKIDLVFKIIGATPTHSILDKFNLPIYIRRQTIYPCSHYHYLIGVGKGSFHARV